MLKLDLRVGETLAIGGALLTLEKKSGQQFRVAITADKTVKIAKVPTPIHDHNDHNAQARR